MHTDRSRGGTAEPQPRPDATHPPTPRPAHHGDARGRPGPGRPRGQRPGRHAAGVAGASGSPRRSPASPPTPTGGTRPAAVAARHGRAPEEVLLTAGAAEAFVLLARALRPRRAVVVHPQFTEPEAALRAAGHPVHRVLLEPGDGFALDPGRVPDGRRPGGRRQPDQPDLRTAPARRAARGWPARAGPLVVDEAFMDAVPGRAGVAGGGAATCRGCVVVRSLTKTWGLAGLRVGYVLGRAGRRRGAARGAQPLWAVSTPALAAAEACTRAGARWREAAGRRERGRGGPRVPAGPAGARCRACGWRGGAPAGAVRPAARCRTRAGVRQRLRALGYAVRRGDTFPGLGPDWLRVAVRDRPRRTASSTPWPPRRSRQRPDAPVSRAPAS